jgi:hypothetical protein
MVLGLIASLNVTVMALLTATDVAPPVGLVETTVGAVGGGGVLLVPELDPPEHPLKVKSAKASKIGAGERIILFLPIG